MVLSVRSVSIPLLAPDSSQSRAVLCQSNDDIEEVSDFYENVIYLTR